PLHVGYDHRCVGHTACKQKLTGCAIQAHDTKGYDHGITPTTVQSERRSRGAVQTGKEAHSAGR
ncbi:hypothetical protein ACNVD4_17905, partial [Rhizobium sp. BR5]